MGASSISDSSRMEFDSRPHAVALSVVDEGAALATLSVEPTLASEIGECDACQYCNDTCDNVDSCISCQKKRNAMHIECCREPEKSNWFMGALSRICPPTSDSNNNSDNTNNRTYTMCELRRHNHADSAWILVGNTIYDATPYIKSHPGGTAIIIKKSGGAVDCTEDLRFHSKRAQKEWRRFRVGTLCSCPSHRCGR